MDESGRHAAGQGGGIGEPVQAEGIGDTPLRPDERPTYRTDPSAGDASTVTDGVSPAAEPRPWIAIGVALLVVFVAILAWAVVQPLL
jgi:hypothetical protein